MKTGISEYLRRTAMVLHFAAFKENVIDTWNKSSKNPDIFIEKIQPILQRYEKGNIDTPEMEQLKKDVETAFNELIKITHSFNFGGPPPIFKLYSEEKIDAVRAERDVKLTQTGSNFPVIITRGPII